MREIFKSKLFWYNFIATYLIYLFTCVWVCKSYFWQKKSTYIVLSMFLLQSCSTSIYLKKKKGEIFSEITTIFMPLQLNTIEKILTDFESCAFKKATTSIGTSYISFIIHKDKLTGYIKPIDKKSSQITPVLKACIKEIEGKNYSDNLTYTNKKAKSGRLTLKISKLEFDALVSPIRNISFGPKTALFHLRNLKEDKEVILKALKVSASSKLKLTVKEKRIFKEICERNTIPKSPIHKPTLK